MKHLRKYLESKKDISDILPKEELEDLLIGIRDLSPNLKLDISFHRDCYVVKIEIYFSQNDDSDLIQDYIEALKIIYETIKRLRSSHKDLRVNWYQKDATLIISTEKD